MKRRSFLKKSMAAGLYTSTLGMGFAVPELFSDDIVISILHTNDVHSRLDPFPNDGGRNAGLGGTARRAALIKSIRASNPNVLLLDAGDILQGTPYFNLFKGELDFKLMNEMAYDVATIGNHDFDAGIDQLGENIDLANFKMVNCNYNFTDTPLNKKIEPYTIIEKAGVKFGIMGVGIELNGLVPKAWYKNTVWSEPLKAVQRTADHLNNQEKCDYVICLSHLGYSYRHSKVSDTTLAQETNGIDMILGGHTHTFLDSPDVRRNNKGEAVIISQVGWAGIKLGRIDVTFTQGKGKKCMDCKNTWVRDL